MSMTFKAFFAPRIVQAVEQVQVPVEMDQTKCEDQLSRMFAKENQFQPLDLSANALS